MKSTNRTERGTGAFALDKTDISKPAFIRHENAFTGAAFSCYSGHITGITLELKPGKRIVQARRSRGWPEGHYSIVTFANTKPVV